MSVSDDEFIETMTKYVTRNESFISAMKEYVNVISHEIKQAEKLRDDINVLYEDRFDIDMTEYVPNEASNSHLTLIK